MINDFFANFFEIGKLYNTIFSGELLNNGVYAKLGYLMLGIPLLMMVAFYILWKYPFGKVYHWVLWWILGGVLVSIFSYQILGAELAQYLYDPTNYPECNSFVNNIVIVNGFYGLASGFIFSMILKQFPKPQSALPFIIKRK